MRFSKNPPGLMWEDQPTAIRGAAHSNQVEESANQVEAGKSVWRASRFHREAVAVEGDFALRGMGGPFRGRGPPAEREEMRRHLAERARGIVLGERTHDRVRRA